MSNLDVRTVADFGAEWRRFDQSQVPEAELRRRFDEYFRVFPWRHLPPNPVGFDLGCGSGRWARLVAERVGALHCVDASAEALDVARGTLASSRNCVLHLASVDALPFADDALDFGYSLGVLHHVPDTAAGIRACARKLKPGAPLLLYLYYAFDNRPRWYRWLWRLSDWFRRLSARLPQRLKAATADVIAALVYWPFARAARFAARRGVRVELLPLSCYRDASFYTMRTDALDRFGTRLEQRFTADQIRAMMQSAGLADVTFSDAPPYWCAVGIKQPRP